MKSGLLSKLVVPVISIMFSLLIGALFILAIGRSPFSIYGSLFQGTLCSFYGIGMVLYRATPLILTGLAVSLAFRAGLFNVGGEGQIYIGAFFTALAGVYLDGLNSWIIIPVCLISGMLAGGLWGGLPGLLKATTGAHEVITTIMLNFISFALANYLVVEHFSVHGTIHTPEIASSARVPRLEVFSPLFKGAPVNLILILALILCMFFAYILFRTRYGYELRTMGLSMDSARYAGIDIGSKMISVMFISGALCGIAGSNFVLGYKYYFELGFSGGCGFMGIAVAILGYNHPLGIVLASILFGIFTQGGLVINHLVPKELVDILQALVIFMVLITNRMVSLYLKNREKIYV